MYNDVVMKVGKDNFRVFRNFFYSYNGNVTNEDRKTVCRQLRSHLRSQGYKYPDLYASTLQSAISKFIEDSDKYIYVIYTDVFPPTVLPSPVANDEKPQPTAPKITDRWHPPYKETKARIGDMVRSSQTNTYYVCTDIEYIWEKVGKSYDELMEENIRLRVALCNAGLEDGVS